MNRHFRPAPDMPNIFLYRDPVDFRKSFRGLAAIVEQEMGHNPFDGRLIYYWVVNDDQLRMLYVYPKGKQEDLTSVQLKQLRAIIERW